MNNLPGAMNTEEMDEFLERVNAVNKQVSYNFINIDPPLEPKNSKN